MNLKEQKSLRYELRKRNLAMLTVHGPISPKGLVAWGQIRTSGLSSVRPIQVLRALWGEEECFVENLCMPCDGAIAGVTQGRFVEGPARIDASGVHGVEAPLPIEIEDLLGQLSLVNLLYAEAGATGSRDALRTAMEVDPALSGVDLLYTESVLSDMMEGQKEKLKRFF